MAYLNCQPDPHGGRVARGEAQRSLPHHCASAQARLVDEELEGGHVDVAAVEAQPTVREPATRHEAPRQLAGPSPQCGEWPRSAHGQDGRQMFRLACRVRGDASGRAADCPGLHHAW